jgi:N-acetylmuramoyl-L-alanine amidase
MVQAARKDGTAQVSASPEPSVSASAEQSNDDAAPEPEAPEAPPQRTPGFVKLAREAVARLTEPQDEPDAEDKARELRAAALAGGASIAAQLGLKVRRVVIDPGHGGKDTGAIGPHGVREKDIALAIARRLATRLRALGFTAVLTRNDDSFVALDERTRIANEAKADLFVSIHCNAAKQRKLSGIETWTLNVASDRYAARLAAFENAEAERTVSDLRLILADLATKSNAGDARELAQSVQASLVRNLRSRVGKITDHGVKQALFYVLLGTHMPSILVETAFLSNPSEEARLRSAKYQEGAAEAIARGVKDFVDGRQRLARAP